MLEILAGDGVQNTKINALQTLKIDQEINAPIIINQYQSVLNVSVKQNVVQAIQKLDELIEGAESVPVDIYAIIHAYQYRIIDAAIDKTNGNIRAAAKLLSMKRTTLKAILDKRGSGVALNNLPYKNPKNANDFK